MSPASVLIERLGSVGSDKDVRFKDVRFEDDRFLFVLAFFFGANLPGF